MKGKLARTCIISIVPGVVMGFLLYTMVLQELVLVACIFAGAVLAIPTGMIYYLRNEKGK